MNNFGNIIKNIVDRQRRVETIQEGNGFVPYLFVPRTGNTSITTHGVHTVFPLGVGDYCYIELTMPCKVASMEESVLIYIPTGTGTWDYTINTGGGYCGEDEYQHNDSQTDDGEAVVDDQLECLDISAALTPYGAGDIVGLTVDCDALSTTTAINIIGVRLR